MRLVALKLSAWLSALLLGVSALVIGYLHWQRESPELARYVPAGVTAYAEIPSALRLGVSQASAANDQRAREAILQRLETEFALSADDAREVVFGLQSLGAAYDRGAGTAFLIRFSRAGAAERLLASRRFLPSPQDKARYVLVDGAARLGDPQFAPSRDADGAVHVRWLVGPKLVIAGPDRMLDAIEAVIAGAPALEDAPAFTTLKTQLPRDLVALGYFDAPKLSADWGSSFGLAHAVHAHAPFAAWARPSPSGLVLGAVGELDATSARAWTTPTRLTLAGELPSNTLSYVAVATQPASPGVETLHAIRDELDDRHRHDFDETLREVSARAKVTPERIVDMVGREAVIALLSNADKVPASIDEALSAMAVGAVLELRDDDCAASLVDAAAAEIGARPDLARAYSVERVEHGFTATSRKRLYPTFGAAIRDHKLIIVVGSNAASERMRAFGGREMGPRLGAEARHQQARAAFGDSPAQALAWFDTPRLASNGRWFGPVKADNAASAAAILRVRDRPGVTEVRVEALLGSPELAAPR